jgi:hypothetical protein
VPAPTTIEPQAGIVGAWLGAGAMSGVGLGAVMGGIVASIGGTPALAVIGAVAGALLGALLGVAVGLVNGVVLALLAHTSVLRVTAPNRRNRTSVVAAAITLACGFFAFTSAFGSDTFGLARALAVDLPAFAGAGVAAVLGRHLPPGR